MKKLISLLLAALTLCTLAFVSGCGGPKLEGKWIGTAYEGKDMLPLAAVMEIQKGEDKDTPYTLLIHFEGYDHQGSSYQWYVENGEAKVPVTYDKDKQMLVPKQSELSGVTFTFKEGKWTASCIPLIGQMSWTFEPYDSGLSSVQKRMQEDLKSHYGTNLTFADSVKK